MGMHYSAVIERIEAGVYAPLYLLMGEEPYFIDKISSRIESRVLTTAQKPFNQLVLYGGETSVDAIIARARRYPILSDYQLIIVREAQQLSNTIEALSAYARAPLSSTILVLNYKYKKLDARKQLYKCIAKQGVIFESKRLYEDRTPAWIAAEVGDRGYTIAEKATYLLTEFLGTDLSRLSKALDKLAVVVPQGQGITAEAVAHHIGISKDYNNFELLKALGTRDALKANRIIEHFSSNPKANPLALTLGLLYSFFTNLITYHTESDKSVQHLANRLRVSRFFVADYQRAARHYHLKKATRCISYIREADAQSKGIGAVASEAAILSALVFKILH